MPTGWCLKASKDVATSTQSATGLIVHQVALRERGIDKLLVDARDDNKENDAAYLGKRKCKRAAHHLAATTNLLRQTTEATGNDLASVLACL